MEKGIRLGCGATFGVLFGLFFSLYWFELGGIFPWLIAGLFAGYFADLALRHGDAFWFSMRDQWWWPFC